jgi:hypothetical protein
MMDELWVPESNKRRGNAVIEWLEPNYGEMLT